MLTKEILLQIMPNAKTRVDAFLEPLTQAMHEFEIDLTMLRGIMFLAQIAHESGELRYVREIWNPVQAPWQARYEGRKDLGNTQPGDGKKYMGRGLIQVTGRANYTECAQDLQLPLVDQPELLELPINACRSAAWFWHKRNLNPIADAGDFEKITRRINGGLNGYEDRKKYLKRGATAFGYDLQQI